MHMHGHLEPDAGCIYENLLLPFDSNADTQINMCMQWNVLFCVTIR